MNTNKAIIAAVATVATVIVATVAHKKGWLPDVVSNNISKAAFSVKSVFTKKADVVTPEKGDTSHADAPKAEEVKPAAEASTAEAAPTPAPEAANGPAAAPAADAKAA